MVDATPFLIIPQIYATHILLTLFSPAGHIIEYCCSCLTAAGMEVLHIAMVMMMMKVGTSDYFRRRVRIYVGSTYLPRLALTLCNGFHELTKLCRRWWWVW